MEVLLIGATPTHRGTAARQEFIELQAGSCREDIRPAGTALALVSLRLSGVAQSLPPTELRATVLPLRQDGINSNEFPIYNWRVTY
jgi:hypothetical protein